MRYDGPARFRWATAYRKIAEELGLAPDMAAGHRDAAALLDPVLGGGKRS